MRNFAVFGNPIKHSYSPKMHHLFAEQCGLREFHYVKTLVDIDDFELAVRDFFAQGGVGLNITVPFKLRAFELAQVLTPRAKAAGAVNTLWQQDGKLYGDNTDGIGLVNDIQRLGISIKGARVLLIGAGGASRGAVLPLIEAGCTQLHIANRTVSKAHALIQDFTNLTETPLSSSGLDDIQGKWDIIINASASSLSDEELPIPSTLFASAVLAYDMLYCADGKTAFVKQAQKYRTPRYTDGLGMLVYQGAEAFRIWNQCTPQAENVLTILRKELQCQA